MTSGLLCSSRHGSIQHVRQETALRSTKPSFIDRPINKDCIKRGRPECPSILGREFEALGLIYD